MNSLVGLISSTSHTSSWISWSKPNNSFVFLLLVVLLDRLTTFEEFEFFRFVATLDISVFCLEIQVLCCRVKDGVSSFVIPVSSFLGFRMFLIASILYRELFIIDWIKGFDVS
jgi:hypothetical protein